MQVTAASPVTFTAVRTSDGADVSALAGKPVRLRVRLKDADLFSMRFAD